MSRRSRSAYGQVARGALRAGAGLLGKYVGKRLFSPRQSSSATSGSPSTNTVSFQHDFQSQYKRKRAPKRVVRRARKTANMFHRQLGKNVAQYTRSFDFIYAPATFTPTGWANSQTVYNIGIYGGNATSTSGMDTWYQICNDAGLYNTTGKVLCKSAVLNAQILNSGNSDTLVVDAYKYVARRECYDEPGDEWTHALQNQLSATGATNDLATGSFECTPFDAPGFGSKYLILQKTRYRIAPGNSVYLQMRDSKKYSFETARFDYEQTAGAQRVKHFKGMTKGWIFVARSSLPDATNSFMGPFAMKIIHSQTYHYAFLETTDDRQGQN